MFERVFEQTELEGTYTFEVKAAGNHDCTGESFVRLATRAVFVNQTRQVSAAVLVWGEGFTGSARQGHAVAFGVQGILGVHLRCCVAVPVSGCCVDKDLWATGFLRGCCLPRATAPHFRATEDSTAR